MLQLNIEYEDGSRLSVVERRKLEADHRRARSAPTTNTTARSTTRAWKWRAGAAPGFDDSKWEAAQVVGAPAGVLAAQMAEPLRVTETLKPVSVKQLKPGVYIFDMGQNMVGWCRLRVNGPKGTQVTLRHAETLKPDGSLYIANLRSAPRRPMSTRSRAAARKSGSRASPITASASWR